MFTIKHRLAAALFGSRQRVTDHFQIFFERRIQGCFNMEIPCFTDKAGAINLGIEHRIQPRVIRCAATATAGHPKGK